MERPQKIKSPNGDLYRCSDIDPLLDELERLKADKKPFPSYEESHQKISDSICFQDPKGIYDYFSQFQYERTVFPKVGDMVEGTSFGELMIRGELDGFRIANAGDTFNVREIRPVTRPTREEVVAKLTDEELAVLGVER